MRKTALVLVLAALFTASAASAKEVTISDQEQSLWLQICEVASLNPHINVENRTAIGQHCVAFKRRFEAANAPQPKPKPKDE